MNFKLLSTIVFVTAVMAYNPADANMISCSGNDLSRMTTMMSARPDGPHKWEMYKHLAMINSAMAKDGSRGCQKIMSKMMAGSGMPMIKSNR